jgi:hypothetical protein
VLSQDGEWWEDLMENSVGNSEKRFDDLVRSERYFTATLLPALLFHDNLLGVRRFVEYVDNKAKTEHNSFGDLIREKGTPGYNDYKDVEVITEFHIARDLKSAGLPLDANVEPGEEGEPEHQPLSAPDVVIVAGHELVVCEGKFFNDFYPQKLDEQLRAQRRQVRHLRLSRQIRAYRHVAIVPEPVTIDADVVLTWDEILKLAEELMGPRHYVTVRLRKAVKRWNDIDPGIHHFDGILPFNAMRERCRVDDNIKVGHVGGEAALRKRDLVYAENKPWKWRGPKCKGPMVPRNWLEAARWLEIVESTRGFGGGGDQG